MSITRFFVDAFTSALEQGIATPADLVRHITPEVLSLHLPRTLWARLLTACLGAPRVDATTIVDTVGVANLCEHMPKPLLWACLSEIAATALGAPRPAIATPVPAAVATAIPTPIAKSPTAETLLPPPPTARRPGSASGDASGPVITSAPAPTPVAPAAASTPAASGEPGSIFDAGRSRTTTRPPMRGLAPTRTASAAGASSRRPQVSAGPPSPPPGSSASPGVPAPARHPARRDDLDFEVETDIHVDWKDKDPIPVTDEMVDWPSAEETASGAQIDRLKR